jgi:hypothetical protein
MEKIVLILGAVGAVFLTSIYAITKREGRRSLPAKGHSKTRDNHLPNPAVIQEPPLSKERPISELLPRGPYCDHGFAPA